MAQCDDCRYSRRRAHKEISILECRRYPPVHAMGHRGAFPEVQGDDWCGEHKTLTKDGSDTEQRDSSL